MTAVRFDVFGQLGVTNQIKVLKKTPAQRKRFLGRVSREVRKASRKRLRSQRDLSGKPFTPRASKSRKKMLRGLSKHMRARSTNTEAIVDYKGLTGIIARKQQDGFKEVMTSTEMQKRHGEPDYSGPATREQAKALKEAGYKIRKSNGKGYKFASIKKITETLTNGQAGLILRMMRDEESKKSWVINLPARSFLGVNEKELNEITNSLVEAYRNDG